MEKAKGSRIRKRKDSRIQGFKWKRQRVRGLEGWRVGKKPEKRKRKGSRSQESKGFKESRIQKSEGFKESRSRKRKDSRIRKSEGFKDSEKKGFKDSRIQGVKWFSWNLFKTKRGNGSRGRVEKAEG